MASFVISGARGSVDMMVIYGFFLSVYFTRPISHLALIAKLLHTVAMGTRKCFDESSCSIADTVCYVISASIKDCILSLDDLITHPPCEQST